MKKEAHQRAQKLSVRLLDAHTKIQANANKDGYTIIEIVVVVFVLGILASISIPNISKLATSSRIDEAKALLNTAAADCLQKYRLQEGDKIDPDILSNEKLEGLGFKLDPDSSSCNYLQILPTNDKDELRFPMGFLVAQGKLSKFATPTTSDKSSLSSCKNWAGINCKQDESLKIWSGMLKEIEEKQQLCTNQYQAWLSQTNPPANGPWNKWNPTANSKCPSRPPENLAYTTTCTPNGCNSPVYAFEGKIVGTKQEDYASALDEKYGQLCKEWVAKKIGTNNQRDTAATSEYCGSTQFWFCDDPESKKQQWSDAAEMNACLDRVENASCKSQKEEINKAKKPEGRFKPKGTTLECQEVWFCFKDNGQSGNPYTSETTYNSECKNNEPPVPPPPSKPTICDRFPGLSICR